MRNVKFLEHTADIKFQAFGKTLDESFENSAKAMFSVMYNGRVKEKIRKEILADGKDNESLLYRFLEELLFLLDTENFFLSTINVKIDKEKFKLQAIVKGDKAGNYKTHLNIKAVTYNDMIVEKKKDGWLVRVVLDV